MSRLELIRMQPDRPPTRFSRYVEAIRSRWMGPISTGSNEIAKLFGIQPSSTGVTITEETALNYAAVFCATALIADDVSSLPLMLYKRLPNGGKDRFENHPLYPLLHDAPNPEMTTMVWRQTLQGHALLWGNGYSEIERDGANRPIALWPITPDRVTPMRQDNRLKYRVSNSDGGFTILEQMDVIHVHGLGFDGATGYSVVTKARESMSLGVATEKFGGTFFGNGSSFGGVFEHPTRMSQPAQENFRKMIEARHQGVDRAHKFLIVEEGMKYARLGIPPNDAQFLETRVFQIREIARWFKVPPHKLADLADATFSNVEQQNIDYYTSCLRPWLEAWEQELERKLIARLERSQQFIEHVTQALMKADAAGRAALYPAMFHTGAISPNEIRGYENRDPDPNGDRLFVMRNMIPIDRIDEVIDAEIAKTKAAPPALPSVTPAAPAEASVIQAIEIRITELVAETTRAATAEARLAELTVRVAELEADRAAACAAQATAQTALSAAEVERAALDRRHTEAIALAALNASQTRDAEARALAAEEDRQRLTAAVEAAQAAVRDVERDRDAAIRDLGAAVAERDALAGRETAHTTELDALTARVAAADGARAELLAHLASAEGLVEEAGRETQEAGRRIEALTVERDTIAAARETIAAARDALAARLTTAEADLQTAIAGHLETGQLLATAMSQRDVAVAALTAAQTAADLLRTERDGLTARLETATAIEAELRTQLTQAEAQHAVTAKAHLAAELARTAAETRAIDCEAAAAQAEKDSAIATDRWVYIQERAKTQLVKLRTAHRALIIATVERLLQRERDRMRYAQGTPDKFRAWIDTFYPVHAEMVRTTLRPTILAWAACIEGEADALLDREVARHLDESTTALRLVAQTEDGDELAEGLARLLRRWESERPAAVADRLFREGMAA